MVKNPLSNIKGNSMVRMILSLAVVGIVSGVSLVFVYNYAMPRIKVNITKETERSIRNIFTEAEIIEKAKLEDVYNVKDSSGQLLGYAFVAEGNGYQGIIQLIAGVDIPFQNIQGMEVLESTETPGLGAEIGDSSFKSQFKGLSIAHAITYVKNRKPAEPYQIEAITGATISSRAVVNILNKRIQEIKGKIEKRY